MTVPNASLANDPAAQSLPGRVKRILLQPRTEWPVIDKEHSTVAGLYAGYIAPLSAIPPLAALIGFSVFGMSLPLMGTYRVPLGAGVTSAIVHYVLGLAGVYVLALIIDALAPTFGGQKSVIQALKVAAYASTASWLVGVVALIPALSILAILGLYSLYLIYLGLPVLMKVPRERAFGYTAAVIVCAIVLFVGIGAIAGRFITYPALVSPVP